jgi:hypothetical protein
MLVGIDLCWNYLRRWFIRKLIYHVGNCWRDLKRMTSEIVMVNLHIYTAERIDEFSFTF